MSGSEVGEAAGPAEVAAARPHLVLGPRLDLEELWRIRSVVWRAAPIERLSLDFGAVGFLAADAAFLLGEELVALERRGARILLEGLSWRLRRRLRHHPLRRYLLEEDALFTDPDLDAVGFRPGRH